MPYNPYSPGGPAYRDLSNTPLGRRLDAVVRSANREAQNREKARETDVQAAPIRSANRVTLASDSARGRRYITRSGESILVRPGVGVWHVYPCGPRGGVPDGSAVLGSGSTPQDALEDAGYREVAK